MVLEGVMMKLWPEEPLPTPESSTKSLLKLVLKPHTSQLERSWISVMLHSDTLKKVINK